MANITMKRKKSEFERTQEVAKRLLKPSWVKRYHGGDDTAAAQILADKYGFAGRILYMRGLCELIESFPERAVFEQAVRERHRQGLQIMAEGLAHCEIVDDSTLVKSVAPFTESVVGDCYRQAYYHLIETAPDGSFLIHGEIGEGPGSADLIGHAWVELPGDVVYDGVLQRFYRLKCYYETRNAHRIRAFTKMEALMTFIKCGFFGHWE